MELSSNICIRFINSTSFLFMICLNRTCTQIYIHMPKYNAEMVIKQWWQTIHKRLECLFNSSIGLSYVRCIWLYKFLKQKTSSTHEHTQENFHFPTPKYKAAHTKRQAVIISFLLLLLFFFLLDIRRENEIYYGEESKSIAGKSEFLWINKNKSSRFEALVKLKSEWAKCVTHSQILKPQQQQQQQKPL